jgi:GntR family transcriptional regulator, transcriptional repressor for pyruvate dehydrogenase complex
MKTEPATRFRPIRPVRVSEEITEQLKQAIINGTFKLGERLPAERDLAEQFQVSRLSIREALRKLETNGFVKTRQGVTGGAYVTELTFQYLSDAFLDLFLARKISVPELHHVRLLIDPEIARLAALHITPAFAERLDQAYDDERAPARAQSERIARQTEVHRILAEMSGNRFLEAIVLSVMNMTMRFLLAVSPETGDRHRGLHRPIVDAVVAGDSEKAFTEMRKHTVEFGEELIRLEEAYTQGTQPKPKAAKGKKAK